MEHKLILGGEQYLPFARSRIKALLAAGLEFASQKFVFPDAEVGVRIEGEHRYISLTGSETELLSGVIKNGDITVPASPAKPYLSSFKPTQQCWDLVMHRKPATGGPSIFSNEKKLAVYLDPSIQEFGDSGSQNKDLCGSMYSGKMSKLVQLLMSYGKLKTRWVDEAAMTNGLKIKYDYHWNRTHGIHIGEDGQNWLIEISGANGIIAMPLPMTKKAVAASTKHDLLREAKTLFGGLPSGETFKNGSDLEAMIVEGSVIRLMTTTELSDFHSKSAFCDDVGWSFNDTGTEAHNMAFYTGADYRGVPGYRACHYKIDIAIGAVRNNREVNQPIAPGSASLTLVEEKVRLGSGECFGFTRVITAPYQLQTIPLPDPGAGGLEDEYPAQWPVFVCHINGVLDVVRVENRIIDFLEEPGAVTTQYRKYSTVTSSQFPFNVELFYGNDLVNGSESAFPDMITTGLTHHTITDDITEQAIPNKTHIVIAKGLRDGYVAYLRPKESMTFIAHQDHFELETTSVLGVLNLGGNIYEGSFTFRYLRPGGVNNLVCPDGTIYQKTFLDQTWDIVNSRHIRNTATSGAMPQINLIPPPYFNTTDIVGEQPLSLPIYMAIQDALTTYFNARVSVLGPDRTAIVSTDTTPESGHPTRATSYDHFGAEMAVEPNPTVVPETFSFIGYL